MMRCRRIALRTAGSQVFRAVIQRTSPGKLPARNAVKELQFIERRQAEWEAWDRYLASFSKKRRDGEAERAEALPFADLPASFRRLSRDLALAKDRRYSAQLVEALHRRVLAAHQRIYGAGSGEGSSFLHFVAGGFPRLVRQEWRYVALSGILFFVPLLVVLVALQYFPDAVFYLVSAEQVDQFQQMYAPDAKHLGRPRSASSEWAMWGFYIANNVRIDFQCFAGGIAFGVGSIFFLVYNGLMIGTVAGHLTQIGFIDTFWGFVSGHSAFELTGAVLSGAAGLKLGHALVAPGARSRLVALKENARGAVGLVYGAAALTFLAAFIEAFWSPIRTLPLSVKVGVGIALWVLVAAYLFLGGRGGRRAA